MLLLKSIALGFVFLSIAVQAELPASYQELTAQQKQEILWEQKIVPSTWATLPELKGLGWGGVLKSLKSLTSLGVSFDLTSDELPSSRTKLLHPYGSVAKVEFVSTPNSTYTGLFRGAIGIARLSLAGDQSAMGYTPGMALKFFVDGQPSRNIHVMQKLDGQGEDKNFFANTFSNILPEPNSFTLKLAAYYFGLFVENPTHLSVDHLAISTTSGLAEFPSASPYQIFFQPTLEAQIASDSSEDFRIELAKIPVGARIYDVYAKKSEGSESELIGQLYLRSEFVASHYGDHDLFFQHHQ